MHGGLSRKVSLIFEDRSHTLCSDQPHGVSLLAAFQLNIDAQGPDFLDQHIE